MFTLTPDILSKIGPTIKGDRATAIAGLLTDICPKYGINSNDIVHEFLANLLHESKEFKDMEEGLNYSVAGLLLNFKRHRITEAQAEAYGRIDGRQPANKQMIANIIYGGDFGRMELGNTQPGDGWLFRGGGAIQLTGRKNVTLFTDFYNKLMNTSYTPEQMADLLRTDMGIGIHAACWFFAIAKNLIQLAIDDMMKTIVKRINGGFIGINERVAYYERAKKYLP